MQHSQLALNSSRYQTSNKLNKIQKNQGITSRGWRLGWLRVVLMIESVDLGFFLNNKKLKNKISRDNENFRTKM